MSGCSHPLLKHYTCGCVETCIDETNWEFKPRCAEHDKWHQAMEKAEFDFHIRVQALRCQLADAEVEFKQKRAQYKTVIKSLKLIPDVLKNLQTNRDYLKRDMQKTTQTLQELELEISRHGDTDPDGP